MHHQQGRHREKRSADPDLSGTKERHARLKIGRFAIAALLAALQACSAAQHSAVVPEPAFEVPSSGARPSIARIGKYIKHVVIVVQENRSLDNLFAGYPGADAPVTGYTKGGAAIALQPTSFKGPDINHEWTAAIAGWDNGKMDGFDTTLGYKYVERPLIKPYWDMAHQYVLADHMFPTEFGPSFTAHLDLIASTANLSPSMAEVDQPDGGWQCNAPAGTVTNTLTPGPAPVAVDSVYHAFSGPFPCFTQFRTMAEVLDKAHVSWKYYAPSVSAPNAAQLSWSAFSTIRYVYRGPDWANNVVSPQVKFLHDAASGGLAGVTWIVPDYFDSDHPGSQSDTGPSWVSAIVNTIGQGPDWDSTAIVIVWDDWGGWYDNVPPPQKDFVGLGIRVPCLIVSPYARKGRVIHTQYEYGSILKFVEQTFALPAIGPPSFGYTDTRATSLVDSFDFKQQPRRFVTIPSKYPAGHFSIERPSLRAPDDI
jgi:phospholipase C